VIWLGPAHDDAAGAGAVGRTASAGQGGFPAGVRVPGGGCGDDRAQVLGELAGRSRGFGSHVEEVLQIGDQHDLVTVAAADCKGVGQLLVDSVVVLRRLRAWASR
jgi:hypothetical protein